MKVLIFSDVPSSGFELPELEPDLVILLGDIFYRNVLRIDRKYQCSKVGVLGNHDKAYYFDDTNIVNVHKQLISLNGLKIAGFQGSPIYNDKPFGQHTDVEAESFIKSIDEETIDLFLAHSNPVYNDTVNDNAHRGFKAFNRLIQNNKVSYFLHGHLHDPFQIKERDTSIISIYPFQVIDLSTCSIRNN